MGIRRGSTPVHKFTVPFEVPAGAFLRIVYAQIDPKTDTPRLLFEKTTECCAVTGNAITVKLTAEETLKFDCNPHFHNGRFEPSPVLIQIGLETIDGEKAWSDVIETTAETCLRKDGVIRDV